LGAWCRQGTQTPEGEDKDFPPACANTPALSKATETRVTSERSTDLACYLVPVDVVKSIQQHLHNFLDLRERELDVGVAEQASQVVLAEVKHKVDAALAAVVRRGYRRGKEGLSARDLQPRHSCSRPPATLLLLQRSLDKTSGHGNTENQRHPAGLKILHKEALRQHHQQRMNRDEDRSTECHHTGKERA